MADRILAKRTLFSGWMNLLMLRLRLGDEDSERPIVEHPSGSAVLAYDPARRVALTLRQPRLAVLHLGQPWLDEAAGGVGEDEDRAETARREALEEAGVRLGALEHVGRVWMTPGSTTERVDLFLGAYGAADRIGPGGGAEGENERIEVRERPLAELWTHAETGAMTDAKLLMLLQALRLRRPELF